MTGLFVCLLIVLLIVVFSLQFILNYTVFNKLDEIKHGADQAIIITGCDSGIGLELAKYFYQETEFTIICGLLRPACSDGYKTLKEFGNPERLVLKRLDIKSCEDIEEMVEYCYQLKKEIRALINNAGVLNFGEFDWLTWDQIYSQVEVNLVGTLRLTRALLPFIKESKGRIIYVSSVNDKLVFPGLSIYSATKNALSTFSAGLGYEMRKFDVRVVTIRLGDFARLTNIMSHHGTNIDEMWKEMDTNKQNLYRGYFHRFNHHLLQNYGITSPKEFGQSTIFLDFRRAILSKNPPSTITCSPMAYRLIFFIIEKVPTQMQYALLDLLLRLAYKFEPTNQIKSSADIN